MITIQHIEEGLSRAYVQAVASRAGVNIGRQDLDYGVDGTLSKVQVINKRRVDSGFRIDFQLKATKNWTSVGDKVIYDLEAKTYNDLAERSERKRAVPLILLVLCLPNDPSEWLENSEDCLLLRKCCYWTTITGPRTMNLRQVRIEIPRNQVLTPGSLVTLLEFVERGSLE